MAKGNDVIVFKTVEGMSIDKWIVSKNSNPGKRLSKVVQNRADEIEATAEEILVRHSDTGATMLRTRRMKSVKGGWEVLLVDTQSGYEGAIEYGRKDYLTATEDEIVEMTRRVKGVARKTLKARIRLMASKKYGGMDGLLILQRAVRAVAARHRSELR